MAFMSDMAAGISAGGKGAADAIKTARDRRAKLAQNQTTPTPAATPAPTPNPVPDTGGGNDGGTGGGDGGSAYRRGGMVRGRVKAGSPTCCPLGKGSKQLTCRG